MSDTKSHYTAVGRRKTAVAKIKISPGTGVVYVNDKPGELYFQYNSKLLEFINKTSLLKNYSY